MNWDVKDGSLSVITNECHKTHNNRMRNGGANFPHIANS